MFRKRPLPLVHVVKERTGCDDLYRVVEEDGSPAVNFFGIYADGGGHKNIDDATRQARTLNALRKRIKGRFCS